MTAMGSIVIKEKGISSTLNWKVSGLDNGVHLKGVSLIKQHTSFLSIRSFIKPLGGSPIL